MSLRWAGHGRDGQIALPGWGLAGERPLLPRGAHLLAGDVEDSPCPMPRCSLHVPHDRLFHVMRNKEVRETEVLAALRAALSSALPASWSLTTAPAALAQPDGVWTLQAPDGTTTNVRVEAKRVVEPRDVPNVLRRLDGCRVGGNTVTLVAAPFLSPRTRELLAAAGAGWFDMTGNLRVQLDRPAVFIDRNGASRNPYTNTADRRLKSLKGPGAARVVRALLDAPLPFGVRELADRAEVAAATSSRVLELLVREDLIERDAAGGVVAVRKLSLARRWTADYGLTSTNQAVPMLAARGIDQVLTTLKKYDGRYAITAEAATRPYLPRGQAAVGPLALLTIYVPDATAAAGSLQLRAVDRGANVVLVEPFDAVVYRGAKVKDRLTFAAPSQVVVDLLTGPGRAPEEGASLIEVLASNDEGWTR